MNRKGVLLFILSCIGIFELFDGGMSGNLPLCFTGVCTAMLPLILLISHDLEKVDVVRKEPTLFNIKHSLPTKIVDLNLFLLEHKTVSVLLVSEKTNDELLVDLQITSIHFDYINGINVLDISGITLTENAFQNMWLMGGGIWRATRYISHELQGNGAVFIVSDKEIINEYYKNNMKGE